MTKKQIKSILSDYRKEIQRLEKEQDELFQDCLIDLNVKDTDEPLATEIFDHLYNDYALANFVDNFKKIKTN